MTQLNATRGNVYRVLVAPDTTGLVVVISDNTHNREPERTCVVTPVSARRVLPHAFPNWVPLRAGDPAFGHVITRYIRTVSQDELKEDLGELSMESMLAVNRALQRLLGL